MSKLNTFQRNNLITGNDLAAEIQASSPELRAFVVIGAYVQTQSGPAKPLKYLNAEQDNLRFWMRKYEINKHWRHNTMNNRKPYYTIPEPSTATHSPSANLNEDGSTITLRYDYDRYRDHDFVGVFRSGLRFQDVRAYRFRAESHCTLWHVRDVFDTLVEIEDSDWVEELRSLSKGMTLRSREMHHYMIYLDSSGCYEIVARSWEALPEEEGAWDNGS